MPKSGLTGSRIRERRVSLALRQTALAQTVGISPAYLNLIEHNRRRIGGKLLLDIAKALSVDASLLTEGAELALLETLGQAAVGPLGGDAETSRVEELAGRFPGWAKLIAAQQHHVEALEQTVEALTDRLTHDPQLAASLHEVLSVVTAIRSTSAILADDNDIDKEWQSRFHRNLYEDSQRLAESSQALVSYLDANSEGETEIRLTLPQEDLEDWLQVRNFHVAELEAADPLPVDELLKKETTLTRTTTSTSLARKYLERYASDAKLMPLKQVKKSVESSGADPSELANEFNVDLATVFRRLTSLPALTGGASGLVVCDSSGTLTFRKPLDGFPLPRFGAACPLWPLYQALSRPMSPIRSVVEQAGHRPQKFLTYAIALPVTRGDFDRAPIFEATMLILPDAADGSHDDLAFTPVGPNCRICPRQGCDARREPSILTEGF